MSEHLLAQLPGFPPEALRVFKSLMTLELQVDSALKIQVKRHMSDLEDAHERKEFLDLTTARELARMANRLLERYPTAEQADQRLIQAAVLYFVLDRDASPDSGSMLGLEDDAQVLHAVTSHLEGR